MASKPQQKKAEATYATAYLVEKAAAFEVLPEIVAGALVGKENATKKEAEEAIERFLKEPKKDKGVSK